MKTILFLLTLTLAALTANAQTNKISQLPIATMVFSNDMVLINATNSASPTGYTTKTISLANFSASAANLQPAPGQFFTQYINVPLMILNPSPNGVYTASPYFTQPFINDSQAVECLQIPRWVTNCVTVILLEFSGTNAITYTNDFVSDNRVSGLGRHQATKTVTKTFTVQPNSFLWISTTNTWPDWGVTNVSKFFQISTSNYGAATNLSGGTLSVIELTQTRTGTINANNFP